MWKRWRIRILLFLAVLGPGFITANVDNDAGGILTYSQAGAQFGGVTQPRGRDRRRLDQAGQRDEAQRVRVDRLPDLLDRQVARHQLGPAGEVDAEVAGPGDGRAGTPD